MNRLSFSALRVRARPGNRAQGWLTAGALTIPVALGRSGVMANKREGDGGTPRGGFRLVRLWWRPDRAPRPRTRLPVRPITREAAWCEDPADRRYNQPFRLAQRGVHPRGPAGVSADRRLRRAGDAAAAVAAGTDRA